MEISTRVCTKCKVEKPIDQFYKSKFRKGGRETQCKECRFAYQSKWRKANPDKVKAMWQRYQKTEKGREYQKRARERHKIYSRKYAREWHRRHVEKDRKDNLLYKLRRCGVDIEWYKKQPQQCAICGKENGRRFNIDHDPKTGKARGLLCDRCNVALGYLNDDLAVLRKAIDYLERFQ